jgi:hypothetical protein
VPRLLTGGIPLPSAEGAIGGCCRRERIGLRRVAALLKNAELATGNGLENMFATVDVPKVEIASGRSAQTPRPKAPQGHPMPRPIIQVAGITDGVGVSPAQSKGTVPGAGRDGGLRHFPILGGNGCRRRSGRKKSGRGEGNRGAGKNGGGQPLIWRGEPRFLALNRKAQVDAFGRATSANFLVRFWGAGALTRGLVQSV